MDINLRKAAIVGCGFVGASIAFRFLQQGTFSHLVLIDANTAKAEGEAFDLSDGLPYGAALVVITAGVNQKPGETRLELIGRNAAILRSIMAEITARDFKGTLLVVSNPVDVLTYTAYKLSGYPRERVIGSGTVLDTARFKQLLGRELEVDSRNVHAFIMGEHGDSEFAVWSGANISGLNLDDFCHLQRMSLTSARREALYQRIRGSANEIICRKGATYYGIAMAVGRIASCIMKDERSVLPISVVLEGEYGLSGLALSIPSIVGRNGLEKTLEIPLSTDEERAMRSSAKQLLSVVAELKL